MYGLVCICSSRKSQRSIGLTQSFFDTRPRLYMQIECLHKLILMKHIQMTFVFRKALSFLKNQLCKVVSGIISCCYFGNARRGSNL